MVKLHIYAPGSTAKEAHARTCPGCNQRTRLLKFYTPRYGWDATCIRCGQKWIDGESAEIPKTNGIRTDNIESAKIRWRVMPPKSSNHSVIQGNAE
jgi:hypothetical protein